MKASLINFFGIIVVASSTAGTRDLLVPHDDAYLDPRPSPPTNLRVVAIGEMPIDAWFEQLKSTSPDERSVAAETLKGMNNSLSDHLPKLALALKSQHMDVRRKVSVILFRLGERSYPIAPQIVGAFSDSDTAVRLNAIATIAEIGTSATFATPALISLLTNETEVVRAYAVAALGNVAKDQTNIVETLLNINKSDPSYFVRSYALRAIGEIGANARQALPILSQKLASDGNLAATIIAEIAIDVQDKGYTDAIEPLKSARKKISEFDPVANKDNLLVVNRAIKYLELLGSDFRTGNENAQKIQLLDELPAEFYDLQSLMINGQAVQVSSLGGKSSEINIVGSSLPLKRGLNFIELNPQQRRGFNVWFEDNKLRMYASPYVKSRAIIVAIDDYNRINDPLKRGKTGFPQLSNMVEHAKSLAKCLTNLGFKSEDITELYDESATTTAISQALNKFWIGQEFARTDRLFFYFGGHGDRFGNSGFLITYDFDPNIPTSTSLRMRDITDRNFENVMAHHFLATIDACDSGSALPQFLGVSLDESRLRTFRKLSIIQSDSEKVARNIIVSAKMTQPAMWQNGGVFTQALIAGLNGQADLNEDGIIQFDELSLFLRNEVHMHAKITGVEQDTDQWKDTRAGTGSVLFIRGDRSVR